MIYFVGPDNLQTAEWPTTLMLVSILAANAALSVVVVRITSGRLRKLVKAAKRIAKGNIDTEVFRGTIEGQGRKGDDLAQLAVALESMRRRIIYLNDSLGTLTRERNVEVQQIRDELVEKENALQRANAILTGSSEELKATNEGLSARNEELLAAYEKLEKLDKMKGDFLLIAAHELRTPIQPIIGYVELAERGSIDPQQAFRGISTEARRLASLTADVLDVSSIESGTLTYEMQPLSVKQLIDSLSTSSSKFTTQDGIVTVKAHLDSDVRIQGDRKRLIQALENVVNNAVKFGRNGTVTVQTLNDFDKGEVTVTISDDGPGIPAEILPVLFSKFVTRTPANQRGSGLGLFITKAIIEAHGGKISAENNTAPGTKGAKFTISLPIDSPAAKLQDSSATPPESSVVPSSVAS